MFINLAVHAMGPKATTPRAGVTPPPRRRPGRPPDPEARERILEALRRLLASRDYEALSVEDLIREAGLSRATYYKHFESKEQALVGLFTVVATDVRERVLAAASRGEDLATMLEAAVATYLEAIVSLGKLAPAFNVAQFRSPAMLASREATLRQYEERLTDLLLAAGLAPIPPLFMDALFAAVDRMAQRLAVTRPVGVPIQVLVQRTMSELRVLLHSLLEAERSTRPSRPQRSPRARSTPR
jgi:AcrR family transcriptional regulator